MYFNSYLINKESSKWKQFLDQILDTNWSTDKRVEYQIKKINGFEISAKEIITIIFKGTLAAQLSVQITISQALFTIYSREISKKQRGPKLIVPDLFLPPVKLRLLINWKPKVHFPTYRTSGLEQSFELKLFI